MWQIYDLPNGSQGKKTVNQVIDRILHNQDGNNKDQQESATQDASSWSEEDRRDFIPYKKNKEDTKADRVRQVNIKTVANNLPDSFQVLGTTKATLYGETEENKFRKSSRTHNNIHGTEQSGHRGRLRQK